MGGLPFLLSVQIHAMGELKEPQVCLILFLTEMMLKVLRRLARSLPTARAVMGIVM